MARWNQGTIREIAECIDHFHMAHGRAPSNLEIADETGFSAPTVCRYLQHMREENMIENHDGKRPITTVMRKLRPDTVMVPILGSVSCGLPGFAEENIEKYIPMPTELIGKGDFFFLRANGDSMVDIGIDEGDLVLIRQQNTADPGQVVVAYIEEEEAATLKRYYPEPQKHRIRLHPENRDMQDIYVSGCSVQGIAVQVVKEIC